MSSAWPVAAALACLDLGPRSDGLALHPRELSRARANDMLYGGAAGGAAATAMTLVDIERELTTHEPLMPTDFKRCAPPDG